MLELIDLAKRFGQFRAVAGVSLAIEHGEFFTLLGPSGCGKTTLLRLIAGLLPPDSGTIRLDGADLSAVPPERRPVHTVFQNYALFPHLSVARNIAFPLEMAKLPRAEIRQRVAAVLDEVRLAELANRLPQELSGGQRQRVAIARALVDRPRLLLLDEPLGALDAKLRAQMKLELVKLQQEVDITFIYVTHDQGEALALSHRIAVMREGRIEQVGTPRAIYGQPANRFVADFIGQCNLLDARVRTAADGAVELELGGDIVCSASCAGPSLPGARGTLALRPEAIRLGAPLAEDLPRHVRLRGRVQDCLYEGDVTFYELALDSGARLRAMRPNSEPDAATRFPKGSMVDLAWACDAGRFLPA